MTMNEAAREARKIAQRDGVVMVWGYQQNDTTGADEPGYCPARAAEKWPRSFVHTVKGEARPHG